MISDILDKSIDGSLTSFLIIDFTRLRRPDNIKGTSELFTNKFSAFPAVIRFGSKLRR